LNKDLSCLAGFIKKETDKMRLHNYYYSMGKTNKNAGARLVDRIFGLAVLFVFAYAGSYILINDLSMALGPALFVSVAYYFVEKRLRLKRIEAGKEKLIKEELLNRFSAVIEGKDESEFYAFLKDVLSESGHFTGLETEFDSGGKPTIMIGKLKGESVGVCCKKLPENLKVGADALTEFTELCESRGLEAGVYITNTKLDYSARDYLLKLRSFNLYIADIETLYSTFLSKGCLFSLEEVKRELEGKILYQSKKRDDTLRRILAVRRIWVYLSLGLIITLYSRATPYSRYYLFIAAVLFSLSLTAVARWRIEKFKEAVEEEIKLEKAL